jgi:hypothetical protein
VGLRAWWRKAAARWTGPARLSAPIARLRRQAMTCGPPVRSWGGVLGEGGVADVVQAVLDRPVPAQQVGGSGGASLGEGEAGQGVDRRGPPAPGAKAAGLAGDLDDLPGCAARRGRARGRGCDPARDVVPGQRAQRRRRTRVSAGCSRRRPSRRPAQARDATGANRRPASPPTARRWGLSRSSGPCPGPR